MPTCKLLTRLAIAALVLPDARSAHAGAPDFTHSRPDGPPVPMPPVPTVAPAPPDIRFASFRPFNDIDRFILARLQSEKKRPATVCNDTDFVRRSSLDLCGVIPPADDVVEFLSWPAKDRRARWIDRLLAAQHYADHWTIFWGDLLGERSRIRGAPPNAFRLYLHDNLKKNRPLDEWVREMIVARGESVQRPQTTFLLSREEADRAAWTGALSVTIADAFMGVSIKCAECHDHPFDWWTQQDFRGMTGFFGGTRRRPFKSEALFDRGRMMRGVLFELTENPKRGEGVYLTGATSAAGSGRDGLADLLTRRDNPYFARAIANRLWAAMLGTGLVRPLDGLSSRNPPSHPDLLDWLAVQFIDAGYDLRHLLRLIANSRTYQQSSAATVARVRRVRSPLPAEENVDECLFDAMPLRRMTAEQVHDSLLIATGRYLPDNRRFEPSIQQDYPPPESGLLRTFGVTDRMTNLPRDPSATIQQALELLNGDLIHDAVRAHDDHPIRAWRNRGLPQGRMVELLFLQTLTRLPTRDEFDAAQRLLGPSPTDAAWEDLQWALLNTREFQFIR